MSGRFLPTQFINTFFNIFQVKRVHNAHIFQILFGKAIQASSVHLTLFEYVTIDLQFNSFEPEEYVRDGPVQMSLRNKETLRSKADLMTLKVAIFDKTERCLTGNDGLWDYILYVLLLNGVYVDKHLWFNYHLFIIIQ